ncbi:tyrosine-protein phosphatase Lar-like isoform X2 [Asterias amurensis]
MSTSTSQTLIEVYTPLRNATIEIDGQQGDSTQTNKVFPVVCRLETDDLEATTTVIISSEDASLYPQRLTVTLDPDEEITLEMILRDDCGESCKYRWRKLGATSAIPSNDKKLHIIGLNETSSVFRHFFVGHRERKGLVQVLVRECPSGYWNPDENCLLECSICLNGGMCHPRSGQCICPPGFSGVECENVHGRNIFGQEGQYDCTASSDPHDTGCIGKLFCLPEPFGCTCAAGYSGIDCSEECKEGTYGANCESVCHCEDNSTCLADTGECVGSSCQEGWCGINCQVPGPILFKEPSEVIINQINNVTCILKNVRNPNVSDIVLILPNGTTIESDYFVEYETPVVAEYIFVVIADAMDNEYTCAYNNITLQTTVNFVRAPMLYEELQEVNINQTTNITCILKNVRSPNISDIVLILPNGTTIEADYVIDSESPIKTEYIFVVVADARENEYTCTNANATLQKTFNLTAFEPPYLSNSPTIDSSKVNEITITWNPWGTQPGDRGDPPVVNYIITYKDAKANDTTTAGVTQGNTALYTISGLMEDTKYEFRVTAVRPGVGGAGPPSPPAQGNTTCRVPGPPRIVFAKLKNSAIDAKWKAPDCAVRNGAILGYHYQLLTSGGKIAEEGVKDSSVRRHTFGNLLPCTEYGFHVRGWTSVGNGSFSQIKNLMTPSAVPGKPVNLIGLALNATSLQLSWSRPINTLCSEITYKITYWLIQQGKCDEITGKNLVQKQKTTGNDSLVIGDLLPHTMYGVEVVAITSAGESTEGAQMTKNTSESVPGPPIIVFAKLENSAIDAKWKAPACEDRNGTILGYHYQLLTSGGKIAEEGVNDSSVRNHTFGNLLPCTEYEFHVRGWTSVGNGSFSQIQNLMTPSAVPDKVISLKLTSKKRAVEVSWQPQSITPCEILGYNINYRLVKHLACKETTEENSMTVNSSDNNARLTNLLPYSEYVVSVVALTSAGAGEAVEESVSTQQDVPGIPIDIMNTSKSSRSVTFTWQPPACRERNGALTKYYYKLVNTETNALFNEIGVSPNVTSATFDGLTACTDYRFKVLAQTSVGNSSFSDAVVVTTDGEVPGKVMNLQLTPGKRAVEVSWQPPSITSCEILRYNINYRLVKHLACEETTEENSMTVNSLDNNTRLTNLSPYSEYVVSVVALTSAGAGEAVEESVSTQQDVPGIPIDIMNTSKSSRSVTFTWQPPACRERNGTLTKYYYKLVNTATKALFNEIGVSPNVTSATFDGLTACTDYHFKALAQTSVGNSSFSDAVVVTTDGEAPEAVGDLQTGPLATSIHLNWTQPNDTSCSITSYKVTYKLIKVLQCLEEENVHSVEEALVSYLSTQHTIYGLMPASKYEVSVRAETRGGFGESRTEEVVTLDSVPGIPVAINNTLTSSRSVTFTWQPPACQERNGTITQYTYKLVKTVAGAKPTETSVSSNVTSATFNGLTACTMYHFKVRAHTSVNYSPFSEAVYVTTDGEAPDVVNNIQSSTTSNSIRVTWDLPTNVSCNITHYLISYKFLRYLHCSAPVLKSHEYNVTVESVSRNYTIQDLLAASAYLVSVRAVTTSGLGEVVDVNVSTLESAPEPVTNVTLTAVGPFTASFSWSPPMCEDTHGRITLYSYYLAFGNSTEAIAANMTNEVVSFESLIPCTFYDFTVAAWTSAGMGLQSNPLNFTTNVTVPGQVAKPSKPDFRNATAATIQWRSPSSASNPCSIENYTITYSLTEIKQCETTSNETFIQVTTDTEVFLVDLRPKSLYKVVVRASTLAGEGDPSEERLISTYADAPGQITDVMVSNTTMDSIQFTWSELDCESQHDNITGYNYEFNEINDNESDSVDDDMEVDMIDLSFVFRDLKSCTDYEFRVQAIGEKKLGIWSEWVRATTSTAAPEKVRDLVLRPGDNPSSTIQVTWKSSDLDSCKINTYQVQYTGESLEACSLRRVFNSTSITVRAQNATLRNLWPYSNYSITVRGETAAGLGKRNTEVLQTAQGIPSAPPKAITLVDDGPNHLKFTWQPPICGQQNGLIVNYTYILVNSISNETVEDNTVTTMEAFIDDLLPFVDYDFMVRANTEKGSGPFGRLVVKTAEGVPSPPRNFLAVNSETTRLEFTWDAPAPVTGIISAYQFMYWHSGLDESSAGAVDYEVESANQGHRYILEGLKPYTDYNIKVRGSTGAGFGDWSVTLTNRTAEGAPEQPMNVAVVDRTTTTLIIQWNIPDNINGVLRGYKMKYRVVDRPFAVSSSGRDLGSEVNISPDASSHTLSDLDAATGYEIKLAAETVAYGVYTELTPIYTKIPDITKPKMLDTPSVGDDNLVTLQLEVMDSPYISVYQVTVAKVKSASTIRRRAVGDSTLGSYQQSQNEYITAEFNKTALPSTFQVGDNKTYNGYYNAPLDPGTKYDIQFCGVGKTKQDTNPSCTEPSPVKTRELGTGMDMIVAVIVSILVVMAIVVFSLALVVRRRRRAEKTDNTNGITLSNLEKAKPRTNGVPNQSTVVEELVRKELRRTDGVKGKSTTPVPKPTKVSAPPKKAWKPHRPVSLQDLPEYIKKKKAKGNKGFSHDFASLPDEQLFSIDAAQKEEQRCKNRYANIIPYDCTRVVLDVINDDEDTDYINASYIDGYQQKNAYIATQGPNKSSSPDFWRMVWEQEVMIIVMLTNLIENAKKKCIQYWPDEQKIYGDIVVKLVSEKVKTDFTERTFVISNINIDEDVPREIKQFHYTSWPDMGLPDSPAPLMKFIHEVKQNEDDIKPSPMVVHCSAGVGRTGTFITVDAMLNMVAEEKQINIIDFVHQMRNHRMKMVQTMDQYMFIFEVLVETLLCGETVMDAETFPTQYAALHERNPLTGNTYVEEHFRVLDTMSVAPSDDNCHGGRNEMNVTKNRYHDCIPLDKCRPYLMSPGEDDNSTNYINASFIDGYKKKDGFLATQSPLPNTVVDFWRMIYDYNARVIVMLNDIEGSEDETLQPYWLDDPEETAALGIFELQLRDCKDFNHTIARTFKLKNTNKISEKPRTIHHFEFKKWKEEEEFPVSITPFVSFLELVQQGQRQSGCEGRTAVHCLDGVTRSGIFCASMVGLKKLKEEKLVDVFHAVRNLRRNRDVMVESQDQYLFCYEVLKTYLEENETYANFR